MATVVLTIDCDTLGSLSYEYPEGCPAVELGTGGVLQLGLGAGFDGTAQFDLLVVRQGSTSYELDLLQKDPQPVVAFPDGQDLYLYNNLRANMYVRNDGLAPSSGEDDFEFSVTISDDSGQHQLDPEIRVRSGTGSGSATWVPSNTAV